MKEKEEIKQLLALGKTEEALKRLSDLTKDWKDQKHYDSVILLTSRYNKHKKDGTNGLLTGEAQQTGLTRINNSLIAIINGLTESSAQTDSIRISQPSPLPSPVVSQSNLWKKGLIAFSAIIAVLAGIAEFSGVNLRDIFGKKPTEPPLQLTVFVHGSKGKQEIVLESQGEIVVDFGNRREKNQIGEDGRTNFGEISSRFLMDTIGIWVKAEGFELADSEAIYIYNGDPIYVAMKLSDADTKPSDGGEVPPPPTDPAGSKPEPTSTPPPSKPTVTALTYLSRDLSSQASQADLTIMVVNSDQSIDTDFASLLQEYYSHNKISVAPSLLKYSFVSDGLFANFKKGITDQASQLGFGEHVRKLLLVSKEVSYSDSQDGSGQITAILSFKFSFVDAKTGAPNSSFTINQRRIGNDKAHAYQLATEWVMKELAKKDLPL